MFRLLLVPFFFSPLHAFVEVHNVPNCGGRVTRLDPAIHLQSCRDVGYGADLTGVHRLVWPVDDRRLMAYCDQVTRGGGWMVIQRRTGSYEHFYRRWREYEIGFGCLDSDFWLGLETIHAWTKDRKPRLLIELTDFDGSTAFAEYDNFYIDDARHGYTLHYTTYHGTAGDSLFDAREMNFSTFDRDNDQDRDVNTAEKYHGAWWYRWYPRANLNGRYKTQSEDGVDGMYWFDWKHRQNSLKRVEMKLRH